MTNLASPARVLKLKSLTMAEIDGLDYLNSLGYSGIKPGQERIIGVLEALGDPQAGLDCIIVGGTNGKGSVCATLSRVLTDTGLKTGLFTSPHITSVNERIKVGCMDIETPALSALLSDVRAGAQGCGVTPSYFEAITAAAYLHFARCGVDVAVIEVGMGGSWDATNVCTPLVTVVTNVTIDHTNFLGSDITGIAAEKAGTIKPSVPVVTAARGGALGVITRTAEGMMAPLYVHGRDFFAGTDASGLMGYEGMEWAMTGLEYGLPGHYQIENLAVALATLEVLCARESLAISESAIRGSLPNVHLPGRMEIVCDEPLVVLDGAHNPAAAGVLAESLRMLSGEARFVFVVAMMSTKDHRGFIRGISDIAEAIVVTDLDIPSGLGAGALEMAAQPCRVEVRAVPGLEAAIDSALRSGAPVCITGSLYMMADARAIALAALDRLGKHKTV